MFADRSKIFIVEATYDCPKFFFVIFYIPYPTLSILPWGMALIERKNSQVDPEIHAMNQLKTHGYLKSGLRDQSRTETRDAIQMYKYSRKKKKRRENASERT